jgi:predicted enzyme related to lactoylglutathione lyase
MSTRIEELIDAFAAGRMSRRELIARMSGLVAAAAAGGAGPAAAQAETGPTFTAVGLNHIALRVPDIARASAFYQKHLGMTVARESSSNVFLNFDGGFLALFRGDTPAMDHYCYSVQGYDVNAAADKLRAEGIEPRIEGQRIYFPDADGLTVQLATPDHHA